MFNDAYPAGRDPSAIFAPEAPVLSELSEEGDDTLRAIAIEGGQVDLVAEDHEPLIHS